MYRFSRHQIRPILPPHLAVDAPNRTSLRYAILSPGTKRSKISNTDETRGQDQAKFILDGEKGATK